MGTEREKLDRSLGAYIVESDRAQIWRAVDNILAGHTVGSPKCTLALGYVQSGKTTSMAALAAAAADLDYQIVVAILGSTLLLRDQNRERLENLLAMEEANYRWISLSAIRGTNSLKEVNGWLNKGRTVFLPVLKHAGHISKVASLLSRIDFGVKVLIIDDEADQASLNTRPNLGKPSPTYSAICALREAHQNHLYVQYTATPYAPLLLPPNDPLMPTSVEFLEPGQGYTGGREFLITHANSAVRVIPHNDESTRAPIASLPPSLLAALGAFVAGAACLWHTSASTAPISMLIHPTHRTDAQQRYEFLLRRYLSKVLEAGLKNHDFSKILLSEYKRLVEAGAVQLPGDVILDNATLVLQQSVLWLVNSASDVNKVNWNYSPFHILIGGNKLDRGFTVEGLTISYMNRKASEQVDTTEQRARAFGYRREFLPYCQIHAGLRTIRLLRGIVHTEDDLRANLRDWLEAGESVDGWARAIGLDLPAGTTPSRRNVLPALANFNPDGDWHVLRRPSLNNVDRESNSQIVSSLGILDAPRTTFGRIGHRSIQLTVRQLVDDILGPWAVNEESPGWRHDEILNFLDRHPRPNENTSVFLLTKEHESDAVIPRDRKWVFDTGFVNLFQGRDLQGRTVDRYEGDLSVRHKSSESDAVTLQIHFVRPTGSEDPGLFTLAIHLGDRQIVRARESEGV
jgi:hypothetical protein